MAIGKILFIAAINCAALFFLSLPIIASDGGGGGNALETILTYGFICIGTVTTFALVAVIKGKATLGVTISALALPITCALGIAVLFGGRSLGFNIG